MNQHTQQSPSKVVQLAKGKIWPNKGLQRHEYQAVGKLKLSAPTGSQCKKSWNIRILFYTIFIFLLLLGDSEQLLLIPKFRTVPSFFQCSFTKWIYFTKIIRLSQLMRVNICHGCPPKFQHCRPKQVTYKISIIFVLYFHEKSHDMNSMNNHHNFMFYAHVIKYVIIVIVNDKHTVFHYILWYVSLYIYIYNPIFYSVSLLSIVKRIAFPDFFHPPYVWSTSGLHPTIDLLSTSPEASSCAHVFCAADHAVSHPDGSHLSPRGWNIGNNECICPYGSKHLLRMYG